MTTIAKISARQLLLLDLQLDQVNNWGASAAVNNSSDTTYSTAGAVKKAYDLATSAKTVSDAALPAAATAIAATKLATARTLTIGLAGKSFDGTAALSWSLAEIGAVDKAGDTLTGTLNGPALNATGVSTGQGMAFNGKTAIGGQSDGWLRLNPFSQFSAGTMVQGPMFYSAASSHRFDLSASAGYRHIKHIGWTLDNKSAIVLLARKYVGTTITAYGFEGRVRIQRGGTSAFNIAQFVDLNVKTAYQSTQSAILFRSAGLASAYLCEVTFNSVIYIALFLPASSAREITIDGTWWGEEPGLVTDASGYSVTDLGLADVLYNSVSGITPGNVGLGSVDNAKQLRTASLGGYWGMVDGDGSATNWIRTPQNGLIPYQSGGSSSLGTSSWQFTTIFGQTLYENGTSLAAKYLGIGATAVAAVAATKLATARVLSFTGHAAGSMSFDGTGDASAALTLATTGVTPGSYKIVTVDAYGRVTGGSNPASPTTLAGYGITDAVSTAGGYMAGTLTIAINSASSNQLALLNETDGWSWIKFGKSATGASQGHFAWNTQAYDGHPANAFHMRPAGGPTVLSAAVGVVTVYKDAVLDFQGNSGWGGKLRIGGNGWTAPQDGMTASVVTTNGNLHLDSGSGGRALHLNYYSGTGGVIFGNGAAGTVGIVDNLGNMVMNGTITAPKFVGNATSASNADLLDGIDSTGFARAYSQSYSFGGNSNNITTADFVAILTSLGAFNQPYWIAKGSWYYGGNQKITDTGCGYIDLAGAVVEVFGNSSTYIIRITTPTTTSGGGIACAQFTYVNHGSTYSPGWRRDYNTARAPSAAEVGAMADGGNYGTVTFNNWVRTSGSTGWYNATYGGGMYMTDTTWVRTSHNKKFYVENTDGDAISTAGGASIGGSLTIATFGTGRRGIQGGMADNDYWAIFGAAETTNAGRLVIASGDDGTEPIVVAQYSGAPLSGTAVRTAYLLDENGNTSFPGSLGAGHFYGVGSGNDFSNSAFESRGNGSTNTVYPGYGFHQPNVFAGSLQMRTGVDFYFFQQGGSALANVSANVFNGSLNGNAVSATYLNSGSSSTGVTNVASRINSGFWECSQPTAANGWPVDGSWYHLMASTHSNGSNYFSMQFSASFYDSNMLFFRCTNGNGGTGWNKIWHSGNFDPNSRFSEGGSYGTMYLSNWYRSTGATGWYSQTYGGGIYMSDSTWVRTYGGKQFYVDNTSSNAIYTAGGVRGDGGVYDGTQRVYSPNNRPSPGDIGAAAASHRHAQSSQTLTTLWSGMMADTADVTLSQSWRNFDAICFVCIHDNYTVPSSKTISYIELTTLQALYGASGSVYTTGYFINVFQDRYRTGYFSSNTVFHTVTQNDRLIAIYGVNHT